MEIITDKSIKYIDIMAKDIYIEYTNGDFEYLSFARTNNLINKVKPHEFKYNCADSEKSIKFLNKLLTKYRTNGNTLILK